MANASASRVPVLSAVPHISRHLHQVLIVSPDKEMASAILTELALAFPQTKIDQVDNLRFACGWLSTVATDFVLLDLDHLSAPIKETIQQLTMVKNQPVVALSSNAMQHDTPALQALGVQDVLGTDTASLALLPRSISYALERFLTQQQTERLLQGSSNGILMITADGEILYANKVAGGLLGRAPQALVGERFNVPTMLPKQAELDIGHGRIADVHITPIEWHNRNAYLVSIQDATERRRLERELVQMTRYDSLTGLANRTLCLEQLHGMLLRNRRHGGSTGVMSLDLDHFNDVNESLGDKAGDVVLRSVAERLKSVVRESDLVARLSGNEFAVVLEALQRSEDAVHVARKVHQVLSLPYELNQKELFVTCSIGIATYPECGADPKDLLKAACSAMRQAKEHGGNQYQIYEQAMHHRAMKRVRLEEGLRGALARQEFEVHYQPQVNLQDGAIVGMEALLRWHPQSGENISPAVFIPVAERSGFISSIGNWALRTSCFQNQEWSHLRGKALPLSISVNVSPRQLCTKEFLASLNRFLEETGLDPQLLKLEITEEAVVHDPYGAASQLQNIHNLGVQIALDDFGTSYSSLSHLQRLPIDVLKIDQSFIADIGVNQDDEVLVKTMIDMSHSLGMMVVAEGVETQAQQDFLSSNDCDVVQGYFYSHPLPAADATRFLNLAEPIH